MFSFDGLKRINERSKKFNQELNCVYIAGVMDETNNGQYCFDINEDLYDNKYLFEHDYPYILLQNANEPFVGGYRAVPVRNFITMIVSMKKYVVNIEVLQGLFDNYNIEDHRFYVDVEYMHEYHAMTVKVYGCLMAEFLPHDFFGEKAAEKMTKRVVKACEKNRIPLSVVDKKAIRDSIEKCLEGPLKKRIEDNELDNFVSEEDGYIF